MRRFSRFLVIATLATAALIPAGAAQARPTADNPIYCAPNYHVVGGHCEINRRNWSGTF